MNTLYAVYEYRGIAAHPRIAVFTSEKEAQEVASCDENFYVEPIKGHLKVFFNPNETYGDVF